METYEEKIERLSRMISESKRTVFFGGAGVSTESGIPDFRSVDGLYHTRYAYPPEEIISHTFFYAQTEEFYRFYKDKMLFPNAKPNACHLALAELESENKLSAVITQNIDGLHQSAGSKKVYELHGSVHRNYCTRCKKAYGLNEILQKTGVPYCDCGGLIKPDVVLYEEPLDDQTVVGAIREIEEAQLLIVGGTSLVVYPAAGLIQYFHGKNIVVINMSPTYADRSAQLVIQEKIGKVFSDLKKFSSKE